MPLNFQMTPALENHDQGPITDALEDFIRRHGALNVMAAAAISMVRGGQVRSATSVDSLPDHLLKDVGLPERQAPPNFFNHRF